MITPIIINGIVEMIISDRFNDVRTVSIKLTTIITGVKTAVLKMTFINIIIWNASLLVLVIREATPISFISLWQKVCTFRNTSCRMSCATPVEILAQQ